MSERQAERRKRWRQLIGEQEKSGHSVRAFCRERELGEHSFYSWRQRLQKKDSGIGFALVETKRSAEPGMIELVLASGDRLRIPSEEATLRMVLGVVRERA